MDGKLFLPGAALWVAGATSVKAIDLICGEHPIAGAVLGVIGFALSFWSQWRFMRIYDEARRIGR